MGRGQSPLSELFVAEEAVVDEADDEDADDDVSAFLASFLPSFLGAAFVSEEPFDESLELSPAGVFTELAPRESVT